MYNVLKYFDINIFTKKLNFFQNNIELNHFIFIYIHTMLFAKKIRENINNIMTYKYYIVVSTYIIY